jgi:acetyltransferase-like isoleucine patch superfamily enzyme
MIGYVKGSVLIGKYSFVGPHSVIMPGTSIGKGSIISAFSYVKGTFPDFSIIAGNPAKVIGDTRNMDESFLQEHPELRNFYEAWSN